MLELTLHVKGATAMNFEPRPVPRSATLKQCGNRQRCQGHARCSVVAPELFELNEPGGDRPSPSLLARCCTIRSSQSPQFAYRILKRRNTLRRQHA
jgi:hypothetical protein